jgi:hypothetical protein
MAGPRVAALVVCLGLGGLVPVRGGEPPTLVVNVIDFAQAGSERLTEAEHHVTRIYGVAGITVLWREDLPLTAISDPGQVNVFILSDAMVAHKTVKEHIPPSVLGTAAPAPVKRAWIFLNRIEDVADRFQVSLGLVLGHVIAHEVAHMVADVGHSQEGLMAAFVRMPSDALQGFTNAQSRKIRDAVQASAGGAVLQARDRPRPSRPGDPRSR